MKRRILQIILGAITRKIVKKHNPKVIAVTGTAGKTSTKNAVALFLEKYFKIRVGAGNLNTEFGVPLVFIGKNEGGGNCLWAWFKIIVSGIKVIMFNSKKYPEIIVAEMGADKPGDISYLVKLVKPFIGIVTLIGESPSHLQNYKDLNELILEKSKIIQSLEGNGYAILNFDDERVREMKELSKAKVNYYGFNDGADVKISDFTFQYEDGKPKGTVFNIEYKDESQTVHLPFCFGRGFAYAVAAAVSCGISLGLNFDRAPDIFRDLQPEKGRMNLIEGKKGSYILDDTYNASPASMKLALETMSFFPAERRIAILGDMRELGSQSQKGHEEIGEITFGVADVLITVGNEARHIREKAIETGFNIANAYHFGRAEEAMATAKEIIGLGDLVLVKGSQSMRMEKVVEKIMKDSEKSKDLLVRQGSFWKKNDSKRN